MTEPLVPVTSKIGMPRSRYVEWLQGTRPPPEYEFLHTDALLFFQSGVECGMYDDETAAYLLRRHQQLEAQEAGEPEIPAEVRDWLINQGWQPPD